MLPKTVPRNTNNGSPQFYIIGNATYNEITSPYSQANNPMNLESTESALKFLLDMYTNEVVELSKEYANNFGMPYTTMMNRVHKWIEEGYLEKRRKPVEEITFGSSKDQYSLTKKGKEFLLRIANEFQEQIGK